MKKKKQDILAQLEAGNYDPELIKKVTLHHCTEEEVQAAEDEIKQLENEMKQTELKKPEDFWSEDLKEFITVYCKHYKCSYESPKKISLKFVV